MGKRFLAGLAIASLMLGMAGMANATAITYSDRLLWEAENSTISTVGFEGIAPDNSYVYQGISTTVEGVTFTSSQAMYVIGQDYAESGGVFSLGSGAILFGYSSGISANDGSEIYSFGVDLRGYLEDTTTFDISISTGEVFTTSVSNPTGGFFGIVSDTAITNIFFDVASNFIIMDNFSIGDASAPVPEPSTLLLLGTGLIGLAAVARKKYITN